MKKFFILFIGSLILSADEVLFKIDSLSYDEIGNLQKNKIEVWEWNKDFSLCVAKEEDLPKNYEIEILDKNPRNENYFIVRLIEDTDISKYKKYIKVLWRKDNLLIVKDIYKKRPEDLRIRAEIKYIRKKGVKFSFENLYLPIKLSFQNPLIEQMISQIDSITCYNYLKRLQNFKTRNSYHDSIAKAAQYVYNKFLEFGLDHVYYSYSGQDPWGGQFKANNIVGIKYGQTDTSFIICAHLDAPAGSPSIPEGVAPGADDNGSGSAGVLAAAKAMANYNFRHQIRFICFVGEEQGLIGSETYADSCANAQSKIRGVYNMDMICHRDQGTVEDLDADDNSHNPSKYLADTLIHFGGIYVPELPIIKRHLVGGSSDHASFQSVGYPAILTIDDASIGANPYIHTRGDTIGPSANDFRLMKNSVKAIVATVAELAKVLGPEISESKNLKKLL